MTGDIHAAIATRFCFPEWVVESEITLAGRRLDALAFAQWATRDYRLLGFEVKTARSDWLRELRQVEKSENAIAQLDGFFIVAPKGVVEMAELPRGWGYLEYQEGKRAARLVTRASPPRGRRRVEMPRELAARFLTRFVQRDATALRHERERLRAEVRAEVEATLRKTAVPDEAELKDRLAKAERKLAELNQALGGNEYVWHDRALAIARAVTTGEQRLPALRAEVERAVATIAHLHERARETLSTLSNT